MWFEVIFLFYLNSEYSSYYVLALERTKHNILNLELYFNYIYIIENLEYTFALMACH